MWVVFKRSTTAIHPAYPQEPFGWSKVSSFEEEYQELPMGFMYDIDKDAKVFFASTGGTVIFSVEGEREVAFQRRR